MKITWFPVVITSILLASCSPSQYKVNPSQDLEGETEIVKEIPQRGRTEIVKEIPQRGRTEIVKEIPESQKDGYMRIVGDLRWDQLTSKEEWMTKFPDCLYPVKIYYKPLRFPLQPLSNELVVYNVPNYPNGYIKNQKCNNFSPGSIPVNISYVTSLAKQITLFYSKK